MPADATPDPTVLVDERTALARDLLHAHRLLDMWLRPLTNRTHLGLSPSHLYMLALLRDNSAPILRLLAARLDVTPTTVTQIADQLEAAGYVEVGPLPGDRRRRPLEITEAGRAILRTIEDSLVRDILATLPDQDERQLAEFAAAVRIMTNVVQSILPVKLDTSAGAQTV